MPTASACVNHHSHAVKLSIGSSPKDMPTYSTESYAPSYYGLLLEWWQAHWRFLVMITSFKGVYWSYNGEQLQWCTSNWFVLWKLCSSHLPRTFCSMILIMGSFPSLLRWLHTSLLNCARHFLCIRMPSLKFYLFYKVSIALPFLYILLICYETFFGSVQNNNNNCKFLI